LSHLFFQGYFSLCFIHWWQTQGKFLKIFSKVGQKVVPYARLNQFSQVLGIRKNWNWGAYIHARPCCGGGSNLWNLCVGVCRMPHTRKLRAWKTANGNGSMLTASRLPSHTIVGNTCAVALTGLHPFKSSARATVLVLAITLRVLVYNQEVERKCSHAHQAS
jgi:hypothetical protein